MHRHTLLYIFDKILPPKTMATTVHRSIQEMPYDKTWNQILKELYFVKSVGGGFTKWFNLEWSKILERFNIWSQM